MGMFLETYSPLKLKQEEIHNLSRLITRSEKESVILKNSLQTKVQVGWLHWGILPNIQRRLIATLLKIFQKTEKEGTLPKSFYETTITLIPKAYIDTTKKENYRPISLMNIDVTDLNKILANQIQQHIKRINQGFPGGAVVENLPANEGDTGSSPGLGRSHMPWSGWAREPQLLSLHVWSLCSATREAVTVRGPRTVMKSGPCSPQLEKALAQKRRPNTAKNK